MIRGQLHWFVLCLIEQESNATRTGVEVISKPNFDLAALARMWSDWV